MILRVNAVLAFLALLTVLMSIPVGAAEPAPATGDAGAFVCKSPRDPRYFELSDGRPWIPIGLNLVEPPWDSRDLSVFEGWMRSLAENGGNYIRVWLGSRHFDLETKASGRYEEEQAQHIDELLRLARRHGIRLKLCLEHFRTFDESSWARKPIHLAQNGGPAESVADFFDGERSRKQFKAKLAFLAGRYGSDPIVFGWELWNEVNCVQGGDVFAWTEVMLAELHRLFPRNLCLQSLGSHDGDWSQRYYPRMMALAGNDAAQVHRYLDCGAQYEVCRGPVDVLAADAVLEMRKLGLKKPILLAESGAVEKSHSGPFKLYAKDAEGIILHDVLFAPFFAGAAGPGHIWHWDAYVARMGLWRHFGRFARAVEGIDPPAEAFEVLEPVHPSLRIRALKGRRTILAWVRDPENTWQTELAEGKAPRRIAGARVRLPGIPEGGGEIRIRTYDPWTDRWADTAAEGGEVKLPEFSRSLVVRTDPAGPGSPTGKGAGSARTGPALDRPPGAGEKPYHPADGQMVEVNPPPFIWASAGKGSSYSLQISPSEDFRGEGTRTFQNLRRSVCALRETLPPGSWFWRYGAAVPEGTAWGRARPFTIPASARPFPFPDMEELARRVPRERPRLFFPLERLRRIREAARGELKDEIQELLRSCEGRLGEELVAEPGRRPKEPDRYGPWAVNVMRTTRPPMDVMEGCALAYLIDGDRRLGLEAKRRLLHFFSWDPEGPTSFFAYDEPAMWMMMRGTRAYDWTRELFSEEESARVEANMKRRALQFLRRLQDLPFEARPYDSHAGRLPGFLGECALSFIHEWPEARNWLEYSLLLYFTSYPAWGGDDGGWQEGPGYWSAYMDFALHFVAALKSAAGVDLTAKPFFRSTPFYALYAATPYHEHTPFGDGQTGRPGRGLGSVVHAFSSLLGDPHLRWYAEATGFRPGRNLLGLATYDPSIAARPPAELPPARAFPSAGLVSIHTALGKPDEDVSFLLRSSPFGSVSHGHADQNAFVLEASGRGLAIATGYYPWYGSPHHQDWTRATRAVNSVLVDGEGQDRRSAAARGEITAFREGDGYDFAEGEAGAAYGGRLKRFRRSAIHARPGVFILFDDLEASKPATFQWLLHAHDRIAVDEGRQVLRIERPPAEMEVHLLLPGGLAIRQTDRYEPEPESTAGDWKNTWHLTAGTSRPEARARFLAVLLPHRRGSETALPRVERVEGSGAAGVRITFPDGSEELAAFRLDPGATASVCGGLESDARVFARGRQSDGTVSRRLLIEGSSLTECGKAIEAPAAGTSR